MGSNYAGFSGHAQASPAELCKSVPVERELDRLDDCLQRLTANLYETGMRLIVSGDRLFGPVPEAPSNVATGGLVSKDTCKIDTIWQRVRDLELIAESLARQAQRLSVL